MPQTSSLKLAIETWPEKSQKDQKCKKKRRRKLVEAKEADHCEEKDKTMIRASKSIRRYRYEMETDDDSRIDADKAMTKKRKKKMKRRKKKKSLPQWIVSMRRGL